MALLTKWLNDLVNVLLSLLLLFVPFHMKAQRSKYLTLQQVFQLSEQNYPAIRQKNLIKQTQDLSTKNLTTGFLPQLSFIGQATYQSDVTRVDIPIPNIKIPSQSKDQYKVVADVNQMIYDGGLIKEQKNIQNLVSSVEERKLEVELYSLKNRVTQIYFNILYQNELLKQSTLLSKDIEIGINKVEQQVNNGVVLRSNLQVLQVQLLQAKQKAVEIRNVRRGLTEALSLFINQEITDAEQLQMPLAEIEGDTSITRAEITLYEAQSKLFEDQRRVVDARNFPKASAFVQAGYGKPALNLLANNFDFFYITGLRLNWSLGGLYNSKREKALLDVNRRFTEIQKETFLLNTRSQLQQQQAEITKFAELVQSDKSIIELRSKITEAAKAQLENAVITANDYLREINAGDAARQSLATHELQLLQAQISYQLITGKL